MTDEQKNYYFRILLAWFLLLAANLVVKSAQQALQEAATPNKVAVVEVEVVEQVDAVAS